MIETVLKIATYLYVFLQFNARDDVDSLEIFVSCSVKKPKISGL